jgi:hypothetical protein
MDGCRTVELVIDIRECFSHIVEVEGCSAGLGDRGAGGSVASDGVGLDEGDILQEAMLRETVANMDGKTLLMAAVSFLASIDVVLASFDVVAASLAMSLASVAVSDALSATYSASLATTAAALARLLASAAVETAVAVSLAAFMTSGFRDSSS